MKQFAEKFKRKSLPIPAFALFIILSGLTISAQPPDQKLAQANKAYREGSLLFAQQTQQSIQNALAKFQTARLLYKEIGEKNGEGKALLQIGVIFQDAGRLGEALESYKAAYNLFKATSNMVEMGTSVNRIGRIYSMLGNKKLALDLYNQALRIFYDADAFIEAIPTLNNIGIMYQEQGDNENALFYFNLALPHVRERGDINGEALILGNIGDVYSEKGDLQKAIEYFKKTILLHQKTNNQQGESRDLLRLGIAIFRTGNKKEAIKAFNRSLAVNGSRFKMEESLTLWFLMISWIDEGNQNVAVFYGKQVVNNFQSFRQGIQILEAQTQRIFVNSIGNSYRQLADLLISQGKFAQAEQVLRMLKEEEYFEFVRRDADEIKSLNQRVSLDEKERKLVERYASLTSRITEIEQEITRLNNKNRTNTLSAEEQKRYEKLANQLADANAAFALFLEKELVNELDKTAKNDIEFDRNLQAKLKKWGEGTVTLYTVVTEKRYRVILTTPNVQVDGKTEISAEELNKKIFAYREALQNIETDPRPLGKELYDILIKPIEKDLQAANAKTLVWSLDGTLRYIPVSTLSPDGKSYLIEKYRSVITTPRTRDDVSDLNIEWRALGVGVSESQTIKSPENPEEEIEFSSLPGSKEELLTIIDDEEIQNDKGILLGRRFLDKDFTVNSLAESLGTRNGERKFTAVHIASHFQLGTNWANSFLLLGNGEILTLKDLKNSPEYNFGDVELVTLSACDTAFTADSNGKEVDSLASVIQAKNGKAVLAALWAVVDESTPLLMSEFYRLRKANPKMTKAEAMQIVQKGFITGMLKPGDEYIEKLASYFKSLDDKDFKFDKNAPFAHPYFWSPFVLIGNWR